MRPPVPPKYSIKEQSSDTTGVIDAFEQNLEGNRNSMAQTIMRAYGFIESLTGVDQVLASLGLAEAGVSPEHAARVQQFLSKLALLEVYTLALNNSSLGEEHKKTIMELLILREFNGSKNVGNPRPHVRKTPTSPRKE